MPRPATGVLHTVLGVQLRVQLAGLRHVPAARLDSCLVGQGLGTQGCLQGSWLGGMLQAADAVLLGLTASGMVDKTRAAIAQAMLGSGLTASQTSRVWTTRQGPCRWHASQQALEQVQVILG